MYFPNKYMLKAICTLIFCMKFPIKLPKPSVEPTLIPINTPILQFELSKKFQAKMVDGNLTCNICSSSKHLKCGANVVCRATYHPAWVVTFVDVCKK